MFTVEKLKGLQRLCAGAKEMSEGAFTYVHLPLLKLPAGCNPPEVEGLLRPGPGADGYPTKLYFSAQISGRSQNWTTYVILGKTWYSFSWKDVPADLSFVAILANHLRGLK